MKVLISCIGVLARQEQFSYTQENIYMHWVRRKRMCQLRGCKAKAKQTSVIYTQLSSLRRAPWVGFEPVTLLATRTTQLVGGS